jgi:hypothetical protein
MATTVNTETPLVNEPLVRYKQLYSEYLGMVVELHNYHYKFLEFKNVQARNGNKIRNHLRKMKRLELTLTKTSKEAELMHYKLNPPKKGPKPKE